MTDKQIILELARTLDIADIKAKHKMSDAKLSRLLIMAANLLPDEPPQPVKAMPSLKGARDLIIFVDGAARGNPGPASIGVLICDSQGEEVLRVGRKLGQATNNLAEYQALLAALKLASDLKAEKVLIKSDSELVVKQMTGQYKVKNANLRPLFLEAKKISSQFKTFYITHIPREQNKIADSLANAALDNKLEQTL